MPEPLGEPGESRGAFYHVVDAILKSKGTKNEPPRLPLRLEGNPEGGVGTGCDSSPKVRGYKKKSDPGCGVASRKVLITHTEQSQNKLVVQRCVVFCARPVVAAGVVDPAALSSRERQGRFLENAKAFVNTQLLMLYKGWRLFRRT